MTLQGVGAKSSSDQEAAVRASSFVPPARPELAEPDFWRPDSTKSDGRDRRLLWLDKNENTDPVLAAVTRRVLAEMDPSSVARYPDSAPLYGMLAAHVGVDPHALCLTPGSDGGIGAVFRTFVGPGDRVVYPHPTYRMYEVYSRMCGARSLTVAYERGPDGPRLSVDAVNRLIVERRPKLVGIPNPDSPTGTVLDLHGLRSIIASALHVGAMVLVDEAYHPFYAPTVVPLLPEFPNLIVVRSFSKAWGLAGVRLGYTVSSPAVATLVHKVRPCYEVSTLAVEIASRMLRDFEGEMLASVKRLTTGRDAFIGAMGELGLRTLTSHGSFAHVAFGDFGDAVHAALASIALYTQQLAPPLESFSRFSATTPELFQPVVESIRSVVRPRA
jgi:histidinol-phosphate aminotransferase